MLGTISRIGIALVLSAPLAVAGTGVPVASGQIPDQDISRITGTVRDTQGNPVAGAMVTVRCDCLGASEVAVFTDPAGAYQTPELSPSISADGVTIISRKAGYESSEQTPSAPSAGAAGAAQVDFTLTPVDNVADQVPGSAWISLMPDTNARRRMVYKCSDCHETPGTRVKAFASTLEGLPVDQREEAWREAIEFMRAAMFTMATPSFAPTDEEVHRLRWDIDPAAESFQAYIQPENSRHNQDDEDIIAPFLAEHMPTDFSTYSVSDYRETYNEGGTLGANENTYFKVYELPRVSLVREVSTVNGLSDVWGVDTLKNRLLKLDPDNGDQEWYETPSRPSGPHSIWPDKEGNLWVTLEESGEVAIFDPRTNSWGEQYVLGAGGTGIVHDICQDDVHDVAFDAEGRVWMTFTGMNMLGSLDPTTGEVELYTMPLSEVSPMQTLLYGCVMTSDRNVWFSQIGGVVGEFNTQTLKVETILPFAEGAGPRRLAVGENDILYIPLFGEGQLVVHDTIAGEELGRYDLPDTVAAPYSATWDPQREVVWVSSNSSDRIFRFDTNTTEFTQFPLPRGPALLRMILLDYQTGDLWLPYSTFPLGDGPSVLVMMHPGD